LRERSRDFRSRLVEVEWSDASRQMQKAVVRLTCQDRKGLLSDVSGAITQLGFNILGAHTHTSIREGRAILKLVVLIKDAEQLNTILNRLATIPGVLSLSRVVHEK
jgi:GTP pyrophosphokinase